MLETLDAAAVRRWGQLAADVLRDHRAEIDLLNVYPVPDGDTGTNLSSTVDAAAAALVRDGSGTVGTALQAMAHGAVLGARGNSGVIISQILRGLGDAAASADRWDGPGLQRGLQQATERAYRAVAEPVEGTILTVCRAAADRAASASSTLVEVVRGAVSGAAEALVHTPEQLPALARAGVVDAGGSGLLLLLQALANVVTGEDTVTSPSAPAAGRSHHADEPDRGPAYEVQYQLHAADPALEALRDELARLGDSLVIAGTGDGYWLVHVHVDDIGAAVEAGIRAGRPYDIRVTRFADQQPAPPVAGAAIVAVAPGEGLAHLFEAEGVAVVETNPSTGEVVAAVRGTGARAVVLLPNATRVTGVAELAAQQCRAVGLEVAVVPTRSPVQGLAAVAVHDPDRRFDDDVVAMAEAAAATRFAELTVAVRDALTSAGPCRAGDVLGLIDGDVVEIGADLDTVALAVLARLLGVGGELVTIVVGRDAPPGLGERLCRHVEQRVLGAEVTLFAGGQPTYPLLIGVE